MNIKLSTLLLALLLLTLTACAAPATQTPIAPTPTAQAEARATDTPAPTETPAAAAGAGSFTNPVLRENFADPFLLKEGDTWYAYATNSSSKNVPLSRSTDLITWSVSVDAMPALGSWVKPGLTWRRKSTKLHQNMSCTILPATRLPTSSASASP